jgi:hypothetical protein
MEQNVSKVVKRRLTVRGTGGRQDQPPALRRERRDQEEREKVESSTGCTTF